MEGKCIANSIVIGINLIFGLFRYKTRGSCVYNKTAEIDEIIIYWKCWLCYKWE